MKTLYPAIAVGEGVELGHPHRRTSRVRQSTTAVHEAENAGSVIAHEVAHYYWSGNADWVDEGAADFMASIIEGARSESSDLASLTIRAPDAASI